MKLLAMVTEPKSVRRYLARIGEPTDVPGRSPSRGPPKRPHHSRLIELFRAIAAGKGPVVTRS
jgi:hypothetical protein